MIRKATLEDAPRIADLYSWYVMNGVESFETAPVSAAEMRRRMAATMPRWPYYVAEERGRVEGFCYAHPWKERAAYCNTLETTIYLSPSVQRQGVGTALMRRLIADCRALGCRALIACITGENTQSQAFHRRLGFEQVSLFRSVGYKMGRWLDVVDMELLLW